ncbi:ABC transporter permease [Streptomyces thermoalcalitolerans]|uniref:ABC transporter permease n=1 Tax=Streptomyces thermoalcalitolerans TaxID=65605 RepID=A0ABN1NMX7_9ACTN
MGVGFACTGGREGWTRMLLTAVGVGLGAALLLLTTAVPNVLTARHQREEARLDYTYSQETVPKADNTLVIADVGTSYHDKDIRGRLVEPEGPRAPLAPGLTRYPAPGEMIVSPALKELLDSEDGKLLRERLPYRVTGTIGESGLIGPRELAYYAGAENLASRINGWQAARITEFGRPSPSPEQTDPVLLLLVMSVFVVLLMPVAVFIGAAVRFGGEQRDRRLAALRLVGADTRMTRWIAAGEALAGALLGLVFGTVFFLIGRRLAGSVEVLGISVFPGYLDPSPVLAALVAVAVPATAVLVTLLALRGVAIEPLGVVRTAKPPRRRLWWRLLLPLGGLAMLLPMLGQGRTHGTFNQFLVVCGVALLLVGVTALLPWVVETVVARLGGGGVSWQLAVRRLQLSSGTAARLVNGIAVAVAGAIALQMLFAGVESDYTRHSENDLRRAQMQVNVPEGVALAAAAEKLSATRGVREVTALSGTDAGDSPGSDERLPDPLVQVTIGDCDSLRQVARLPSCRDGDVFTLTGADHEPADADTAKLAEPGRRLYLGASAEDPARQVVWTVPAGLKSARSVKSPTGERRGGFLLTPAAVPAELLSRGGGAVFLKIDPSVPDAPEHVRNTAARVDPLTVTTLWVSSERTRQFASLRTGLFIGSICVLLLIGASLLVSQLEQLRERKKLLAALVAFGTRRRTLSLSVLWQTAVPVALGLLLASAVGLTLGAVLLGMTDTPVAVDWWNVLAMAGIGAGVVLAVTLLSLPPLLRLMRPDGLRTE